MYSRKLDKKTLTFGHEGVLYKNSFIMYDKETNSKWVHVTGTAVKGPLKGKKLEEIPSVVTTWKEWKETHPKTKVLSGRRRGGFMGTYSGKTLRGFGYCVQDGGDATLYSFTTLAKKKVINDKVGETDLVIVFSEESAAPLAWERGKLTFESVGKGKMKDKESGSIWSILKGECLEGKKKGEKLTQRAGVAILVERFRPFWPKGKRYKE